MAHKNTTPFAVLTEVEARLTKKGTLTPKLTYKITLANSKSDSTEQDIAAEKIFNEHPELSDDIAAAKKTIVVQKVAQLYKQRSNGQNISDPSCPVLLTEAREAYQFVEKHQNTLELSSAEALATRDQYVNIVAKAVYPLARDELSETKAQSVHKTINRISDAPNHSRETERNHDAIRGAQQATGRTI